MNMLKTAYLEPRRELATCRKPTRYALKLEAEGISPEGGAAKVLIHNVSANGLLMETGAVLSIGQNIEIDLPEAGPVQAEVMWSSGPYFGCEFRAGLSSASVSAAMLKSSFEPVSVMDETDKVDDMRAWIAGDADGLLSPRNKFFILVGLVIASWSPVFAAAHWLA